MGLFSSYKAVNDEEVFRAVMYSCMAMKNVPGAQYFMHKGKLVVAYNWDSDVQGLLGENPNFQAGINVLASNLPEKYGSKIDIRDNQQKENVPDNILNKTGYVSLYHPEYNRE